LANWGPAKLGKSGEKGSEAWEIASAKKKGDARTGIEVAAVVEIREKPTTAAEKV